MVRVRRLVRSPIPAAGGSRSRLRNCVFLLLACGVLAAACGSDNSSGSSAATTAGAGATTTAPSVTTNPTATSGSPDTAPPTATSPATVPPTTVPPATVPPTTVPLEQRIAECDAEASQAVVVYQPTKQMTVGTSTAVWAEVHIGSLETTPPGEISTLPGPEPTTVVPTSLACNVEARLYGQDFNVTPTDWQAKAFIGSDSLTWEWGAEPKRAGTELSLALEIRGLLLLDNGSYQPTAGRTFNATIVVTAQPESFWTRMHKRFNGFIGEPLVQWIGLPGLIGIVTGTEEFIRRRKKAKKSSGSNPTPPEVPSDLAHHNGQASVSQRSGGDAT